MVAAHAANDGRAVLQRCEMGRMWDIYAIAALVVRELETIFLGQPVRRPIA